MFVPTSLIEEAEEQGAREQGTGNREQGTGNREQGKIIQVSSLSPMSLLDAPYPMVDFFGHTTSPKRHK
ncbi:hypothetical protein FD724_11565 [Nostoc sp. C057]|nr:hypothetical protein FD724_11565 [Nostoc sp. C057]